MAKGPIKPIIMFVVRTLHAESRQHRQNQQSSRQIASSTRYGIMIPTPGITQGASENSRMSYVTGNIGPLSSGANMVPQNANMGTLLPGADSSTELVLISFERCTLTRYSSYHMRLDL